MEKMKADISIKNNMKIEYNMCLFINLIII